jgi:hypothetical protein
LNSIDDRLRRVLLYGDSSFPHSVNAKIIEVVASFASEIKSALEAEL